MNSCVALREANSHAQGIPFDALSKLEPEDGNAPSPQLYQSRVLLLDYTGKLVRHVGNAPTTHDWKSRMYL